MGMINISLPHEVEARIRELAASSGRTPEALVAEAVERLLEDEADRSDIAARLARFQATQVALDHEDIVQSLRRRARPE